MDLKDGPIEIDVIRVGILERVYGGGGPSGVLVEVGFLEKGPLSPSRPCFFCQTEEISNWSVFETTGPFLLRL